jgi:predicted ArsR family transcriptional regulator
MPTEQKQSQKERITAYLNEHKFIDRHIAYTELGIFELSARLKDLEKQGFSFDKERKTGVNRFKEKFNYTEYRLKQVKAIS